MTYYNIVPVADPATEGFVQVFARHPVSPVGVYDAIFEQGTGKQNGHKQYGSGGVQ